jgi:hypothetical protein
LAWDTSTFIGTGTITVVSSAEPPPPQFAPPVEVSTTAGDFVSFALSANDPDGGSVPFAAVGLPDGLSIDSETGVVMGVPSAPGTFSVMVTVTDNEADTDSNSFDWTMADPSPVIKSSRWLLDGDTLDTMAGNHGTPEGGIGFATNPDEGDVLSCDGVDDYVSFTNTTDTSFSFATWIKTSESSPAGTIPYQGDSLISSEIAGNSDDFVFSTLNDRLAFWDGAAGGGGTFGVTSVNDGLWHHAAVVRDAGGNVSLYLDGALDGTGPAGFAALQDNAEIQLCGNTLMDQHWLGPMSDVRLFDTALRASEILAIAEGSEPVPEPGTVLQLFVSTLAVAVLKRRRYAARRK